MNTFLHLLTVSLTKFKKNHQKTDILSYIEAAYTYIYKSVKLQYKSFSGLYYFVSVLLLHATKKGIEFAILFYITKIHPSV